MGFLDDLADLAELLAEDEEFSPDFVLVNQTGYEIHEVYISESDNDEWEEDILGDDILGTDESMNVNFETDSRKRYWDIKTVDEEGDEEIFEQFDLSRVTKIILYYDEDGNAQAEYIY